MLVSKVLNTVSFSAEALEGVVLSLLSPDKKSPKKTRTMMRQKRKRDKKDRVKRTKGTKRLAQQEKRD